MRFDVTKGLRRLAIVIAAFGVSGGCASVFTSIRPVGDGTYVLTRNSEGCTANGSVYRCQPKGEDFECVEIDRL